MKKVLIVSPHFPPINAPDMQRIRMSLPYYKKLGWEPVVLCVNEKFVSGYKDELLNQTVPDDIEVHRVSALSENITKLFGIRSLPLRAYYNFKKAGSRLLSRDQFDLVLFSTSLFQICVLGRYWKKKFGVPFIIDMQDPWRNDFFIDKPIKEKPPKYWITRLLDKRMEAYTMPQVAGIISVSQAYINTLKKRYPNLVDTPALLLPFGASAMDFRIISHGNIPSEVIRFNGKINVVYAGSINKFFLPLIEAFFIAFLKAVQHKEAYHFYFIGTNYAYPYTTMQLNKIKVELGLENLITEIPERISYFSALATLKKADILFIPGSSDADYNASKVYNNIFSNKPIFSIFNKKSLVLKAIEETQSGVVVGIKETDSRAVLVQKIQAAMPAFLQLHNKEVKLNKGAIKKYMASTMTDQQVNFFNLVIKSSG